MQRYEGYHHNKLEPPEEPPYCGICGGSHEDLDCPEDEPDDDDEVGDEEDDEGFEEYEGYPDEEDG